MILEWHDAFTQEMFISMEINEDKIKALSESLGVNYQKESGIENRPGEDTG